MSGVTLACNHQKALTIRTDIVVRGSRTVCGSHEVSFEKRLRLPERGGCRGRDRYRYEHAVITVEQLLPVARPYGLGTTIRRDRELCIRRGECPYIHFVAALLFPATELYRFVRTAEGTESECPSRWQHTQPEYRPARLPSQTAQHSCEWEH